MQSFPLWKEVAAKATAVMAEEEKVGGGFGRLGRAGLRFRGPLDALVFSSAGCFSSRACAWLKRGEETRRAECGLYAAIRQLWRPKMERGCKGVREGVHGVNRVVFGRGKRC